MNKSTLVEFVATNANLKKKDAEAAVNAMFKAIESIAKTSGQYSFEERMGCGFGACMGCTCKTKYGNKRICKDGPVLEREEIVW